MKRLRSDVKTSITVKDFLEMLEGQDPEAEVFIKHIAGDYWRTPLASPISDIEEGQLEYSDYHQQMKVIDSEEDFDEESKGCVLITINQRY